MNPISMGRRSFVRAASLATVAVALPGAASAATTPVASPHAQAAIEDMVAAFEAETDAFLAYENLCSEAAEQVTGDAVARSCEALSAVLDLPKAETVACPDYAPALALAQRRWLVMEGSYADPHDREECLLVDAVLTGHRFDNVRLFWHVHGEQRATRPSDDEFHAGWGNEA